MKIENTAKNLNSFGAQPTRTSDVTVNTDISKVASLLTNIYERPIEAVVRELVCNALDSHTEAGQTKPIDVTTPSSANPVFIVRDYGVGMSDDFVHEQYSSYGVSTKDGANDAIGGFGIGGKSPYAYTDTFMLKCYDGTTVRTYQMSKNGGKFQISTFAVVNSSQPKGVEVLVPVRADDFYDFKSGIHKVLGWIDPTKFNCTNGTCIGSHISENHTDYVISTNQGFYDNLVLCGDVSYELDFNDCGISDRSLIELVCNLDIVPVLPIGSVTIAPNRENLILDTKTKQAIAQTIETIAPKAGQAIIDEHEKLVQTESVSATITRLDNYMGWKQDFIFSCSNVSMLEHKIRTHYDTLSDYDKWAMKDRSRSWYGKWLGPLPDICQRPEMRWSDINERSRMLYRSGKNRVDRSYKYLTYAKSWSNRQMLPGTYSNYGILSLLQGEVFLVDLTGCKSQTEIFEGIKEDPRWTEDTYIVVYRKREHPTIKEDLQAAYNVADDRCVIGKDYLPKDGTPKARRYVAADNVLIQITKPDGESIYKARKNVEASTKPIYIINTSNLHQPCRVAKAIAYITGCPVAHVANTYLKKDMGPNATILTMEDVRWLCGLYTLKYINSTPKNRHAFREFFSLSKDRGVSCPAVGVLGLQKHGPEWDDWKDRIRHRDGVEDFYPAGLKYSNPVRRLDVNYFGCYTNASLRQHKPAWYNKRLLNKRKAKGKS